MFSYKQHKKFVIYINVEILSSFFISPTDGLVS